MHYDHSGKWKQYVEAAGLKIRSNGDLIKDKGSKGVAIGVPLRDRPREEMMLDLTEMETPPSCKLLTCKGKPVDTARNIIVKQLDHDWLFFMDDDQTFPPDALKRLLSWNKDIVSGLVFCRTGEPVPMAYKYVFRENKGHYYLPLTLEIGDYLKEHEHLWKNQKSAITLPPVFRGQKALLEVDGVPGGCLLVHRRVFDSIKEPWFKCDDDKPAGEDFYFCRKAQEAGFKIYVDPGVICGHFTEYERDYRHFWAWSMKSEFPWMDEGEKARAKRLND